MKSNDYSVSLCQKFTTMDSTTHIRDFLEREIVPRYDDFDAGHRRDHVHHVMEQALALARFYPHVNHNMVLVAAAYHDLGLAEGRDNHHTVGARILREDHRLLQWFTPEQIAVMADAAEDHRASSDHEPRTIYGRIVAEADRHIDAVTIVRRALQYGLAHYPQLDREGQFTRLCEHMRDKYDTGGYLKVWIPQSDNAQRLREFRDLLHSPGALRQLFDSLYETEQQPSNHTP